MGSIALKIFRETALPGTLQPYAIYFIAPSARPDYVEIYVTDSAGTAKRVINQADISALISTAVAAATELLIVNDIAARDALSLTATRYVYVKNATSDSSVSSGGATYLYDPNASAGSRWIKISEAESLDVQLTWSSLQNKPTSSVANIDDAVTKRHTHANKTQIDKVDEDGSGNLLYNASLPHTGWDSTGW